MTRKIGYFLIIAILVLGFINILYISTILEEKNIYRSQKQFEENIDKNVLFHGDSHAARAVNPKFIQDSFNFAVPSQTYEQTYFKVRSLVETSNASVHVLPLDIHSFSNYRSNSYYEMHYWRKYLSLEELSMASGQSMPKTIIYAHIPIIGRGKEFFSFFLNRKTDIELGWQKENKSFTQEGDKETVALKRVESHLSTPFDEIQYASFLKTLELLHEHNKSIILISYPVTFEYEEAIGKVTSTSREVFLENVFEDISVPFEFYDFSQVYADNELFSDEDHLNVRGAEMFSSMLVEEVLSNVI